jgi:hypothetical protein
MEKQFEFYLAEAEKKLSKRKESIKKVSDSDAEKAGKKIITKYKKALIALKDK